ncbi:hypothetical protein FGB62_57g010 [Gracilaria domingensis]|nr:hypothetical protein FGB62_57g010 [Gracilaria domingensis]
MNAHQVCCEVHIGVCKDPSKNVIEEASEGAKCIKYKKAMHVECGVALPGISDDEEISELRKTCTACAELVIEELKAAGFDVDDSTNETDIDGSVTHMADTYEVDGCMDSSLGKGISDKVERTPSVKRLLTTATNCVTESPRAPARNCETQEEGSSHVVVPSFVLQKTVKFSTINFVPSENYDGVITRTRHFGQVSKGKRVRSPGNEKKRIMSSSVSEEALKKKRYRSDPENRAKENRTRRRRYVYKTFHEDSNNMCDKFVKSDAASDNALAMGTSAASMGNRDDSFVIEGARHKQNNAPESVGSIGQASKPMVGLTAEEMLSFQDFVSAPLIPRNVFDGELRTYESVRTYHVKTLRHEWIPNAVRKRTCLGKMFGVQTGEYGRRTVIALSNQSPQINSSLSLERSCTASR